MRAEADRIEDLRAWLLSRLKQIDGVHFNGDHLQRYAGIVNLRFEGVEGRKLVKALPDLSISSGSACTSASVEPSHVLTAMGLDNHAASASLRISFGRFTTVEEIEDAADRICCEVERARDQVTLGRLGSLK